MAVKIFFCYAHEDEALLNKLKAHLKPLQRQGLIDIWHDREITAGTEWEREISEQLNAAQIILLLISSDFMNSDYCYSVEMQRAIERHERKEARVIPIILRHVYWQGVLGKLQALPTDALPVTDPFWYNLDKAFLNVAEGIREIAISLLSQQWLDEAHRYNLVERYDEAIISCNQILNLIPNSVMAYIYKGIALSGLRHDAEALIAFDQALNLDPNSELAYTHKKFVLKKNSSIIVHPTTIDFGLVYPGLSAPKLLTISGVNGDPVSGTIHPVEPWIVADTTSFDGMSIPIRIRVDSSGLQILKHYSGTIKAQANGSQLVISVSVQFQVIGSPAPKTIKVDMLKDIYEATRQDRINDPDTIRDLARRFEVVASDPELSQKVDFDASRAAALLYQHAKNLEEHSYTDVKPVLPQLFDSSTDPWRHN